MIKESICRINTYNPESGSMTSEDMVSRAIPHNMLSLKNMVEIQIGTICKFAVELGELEAVIKDLKEEFKNG